MIKRLMDIYGNKENYVIRYKDIFGKEHIVEGEALSKSNAEEQFKRNFNPHCEIVKIQTSKEWIEETSKDIATKIIENIKPLFNNKKSVINPNNTNKINYNSRSFLRGLRKANEKAEKLSEMLIPNNEKMYLSYNN
jgi:hypothetical protein